jgi:DNA segregation ATPase FtsK/SpoIIIE, S-DNA-T family
MEKHNLFEQAKELALKSGYCSGDLLRTNLNIGINAAGMLIDQLEESGIINPFTGSKNRTLVLQPPTEPKTEEK